MISRVTGKNQVTIPVKIAEREGITRGSIIDWRATDKAHVLEVRVFPDPVTMAEELQGRGKKSVKNVGGAVQRLIDERNRDLSEAE